MIDVVVLLVIVITSLITSIITTFTLAIITIVIDFTIAIITIAIIPVLLVSRVAVLDGGLPGWLSEDYKLDETPVSDDDLNAPLKAAQQPPSDTRYKAHLQVCCMICSAAQSAYLGARACSG